MARRARCGTESRAAATIVNNLAELERAAGRHAAAEPLFRRALAILEKVSDGSPLQLAGVIANTAECLRQLGDLAESSRLNARALEVLESLSEPPPAASGVLLNNLASVEDQRGEYARAEALYERAVATLDKGGPSCDEYRRTALSNYAVVLRKHAAAIDRQLATDRAPRR